MPVSTSCDCQSRLRALPFLASIGRTRGHGVGVTEVSHEQWTTLVCVGQGDSVSWLALKSWGAPLTEHLAGGTEVTGVSQVSVTPVWLPCGHRFKGDGAGHV